MEVLPIDLSAIVAIIMGISVVLVPVIGLTARFALKPFVESMGQFFQARAVEDQVGILERRMALMEQQMDGMESAMKQLTEVVDFHRALNPGGPPHTARAPEPEMPPRSGLAAPPGDTRP